MFDSTGRGLWAITIAILVLAAVLGTPGPARAAENPVSAGATFPDADGDGVPDSIDCRPYDATTWSVPSDALALAMLGSTSTAFAWAAPSSPGATSVLYDLIRSTSAADFSNAVCLVSSTTSTAPPFTDTAVPGQVFFYLVRAKDACGGDLGTTSSNQQRTGVSCSTAAGGSCTTGAECASGYCCASLCADTSSDVNNCGGCGVQCTNPAGTTQCVSGACVPTCAFAYGDCDGNPNNGCETALFVPTSCGACFNVCPGYQQPNDNVTCNGSLLCTFSCQGETYDIDNNPSNGCEQADSPTGNHIQGTATNLGAHDCNDGNLLSFNGQIPDDQRVHENPAVTGFDLASGSAPDWFAVQATGGLCVDDLSLTLQTSPAFSSCYRLTVITNSHTYTCTVGATGACSISAGTGAYSDNTTMWFKVERLCSAASQGNWNVAYTVSGHL